MVMVVVKVVVVKVVVGGGGGGDVLLVAAVHLGEVVAVFVCQHWWSHHVGSNSESTGGALTEASAARKSAGRLLFLGSQ